MTAKSDQCIEIIQAEELIQLAGHRSVGRQLVVAKALNMTRTLVVVLLGFSDSRCAM